MVSGFSCGTLVAVLRSFSVFSLLSVLVGVPAVSAQARAGFGSPDTGDVSIGWRFVSTDRFHRQGFAVDGPFESKHSLSAVVTYVVRPRLAVHIGTAWARMYAASGGSPVGLADVHAGRHDTTLGVTYRLNGVRPPGLPTAAVRLTGTLPGPYDAGYTNSLGDGAGNLEVAFVLESFGSAIGWSAEAGYRRRTDSIVNPAGVGVATRHHDRVDVPPDVFASLGVYWRLASPLQVGVEYVGVDGARGLDIGAPDWRADRWPALHEDVHLVGVRVDLSLGDRTGLAFTGGRVVSGRNTPAYTVYGSALSVAFGPF